MVVNEEVTIVGEASPDLEALVGDIFKPVRTIIYKKRIWFCFEDLYRQLIKGNGLKKDRVLATIPPDWKTIQEYPVIDTVSPNEPFFQGAVREEVLPEEQSEPLAFISAKAIFLLCLWTVSPQTKPFQEWVAGELLPVLLANGCYELNGGLDAFLKKYEEYLNTEFYKDVVFTFSEGTKVVIRECAPDEAALFIFGGVSPEEFPYLDYPEIVEKLKEYKVVGGPFYVDPYITCKPVPEPVPGEGQV